MCILYKCRIGVPCSNIFSSLSENDQLGCDIYQNAGMKYSCDWQLWVLFLFVLMHC